MSTPVLPAYYRTLIVTFDIALPILGAIQKLVNPSSILRAFTPFPTLPPAPETLLLLDGSAGFFASLSLTSSLFLFHRPSDFFLHRTVQAGLVLVDVFMLGAHLREMSSGARLGIVGSWRSEDWFNVLMYSGLTVVRGLFALGVGLPKQRRKEE
ncbi:hypothetical protein JCM8547_009130 [Rhodosporidiobolus lusitaniae]